MIYAIGYQKMTAPAIVEFLKAKGAALLIDVRSIPYSRFRHQEFNKNRLSILLGERYIWKGDILGGKHGPATEAGLAFLVEVSKDKIVVIMCMEGNPCDCHRLYDIAIRLLSRGIDVMHVYNGRELTTKEMKEVCDGEPRLI